MNSTSTSAGLFAHSLPTMGSKSVAGLLFLLISMGLPIEFDLAVSSARGYQEKTDPRQAEDPQEVENQDAQAKQDPKQAENQSESEEEPPTRRRRRRGAGFDISRDRYRDQSKRSEEIAGLFDPLVASAKASTLRVLDGNRPIALGTVLSRDGLILTKASELKGELLCELSDGSKKPAVVIGIHEPTDLAILKIDSDILTPIHWGGGEIPTVGQWLASPTLDETYQIQVGVLGVEPRQIPSSGALIGINGDLETGEARVINVQGGTPAEKANLMVGDLITKIDHHEIKSWLDLVKTIGQYDPGDEVILTIKRGEDELKINLKLGDKDMDSPSFNSGVNQGRNQNSMGSRPSNRRKNFPLAFQHDLMLQNFECGGPVLNLNGEVVGINIARAGRVDSLALPISVILPVIDLLKTGDYAPLIVNRVRLAEIDRELTEIEQLERELPEKKNTLEKRFSIEDARREELEKAKTELEKALAEIDNRLKVLGEKSSGFKRELDSATSKLDSLEKRRQFLEFEKKKLATGVQ